MKFLDKYSKAFRYILPNPLSIAIVLTAITFLSALCFTEPNSSKNQLIELAEYWELGLWNNSLLVFAFQMMLMLVLGHVLALTNVFNQFIQTICKYATTNAKAALLVTFFTVLVSLFNWGLGLIFGAIMSRKVGEFTHKNKIQINYPLIGAAGYSGLMVWHGGISGSSLIKVAEEGHLSSLLSGIASQINPVSLPPTIPFSETVFSPMNVVATLLVIVVLPLSMYLIAKKRSLPELDSRLKSEIEPINASPTSVKGAERLDHSTWFLKIIGLLLLIWVIFQTIKSPKLQTFGFINPNYINLTLLTLCFIFHTTITSFLKATESAILGTVGILIQFPLYFGIMGIMKGSGLVTDLSNFFISIANETTLPIFTFIGAGIVNLFVPSGGGQWAIQGPIIIQAADAMNISLSKCILALAYGDQLTNMLQPFWALPLLGITKLKAREILPYTLYLMGVGLIIYISVLLVF